MEDNKKQAQDVLLSPYRVCQQISETFSDLAIKTAHLGLDADKSNRSSEPDSSSDITILTIIFNSKIKLSTNEQ